MSDTQQRSPLGETRWAGPFGAGVEALRPLRPLLASHPWALAGVLALGILSSLVEGIGITLFIPFLQSVDGGRLEVESGQWLVDALAQAFSSVPPESRTGVIGALILGSVLFRSSLGYGYGALFAWLEAKLGNRLRADVFRQLLDVGYGFIERSDYGALLNTLATETWRVLNALKTLLWGAILVFTTVLYVTLLLLISWPLTLLVGSAMLGISLLARRMTRQVKALGEEANRANASLASRMLEGLSAMQVIRTFGREAYEQGKFERASERVSRVFFRLGLVTGLVGPVYEVLAAALLVGVLLIGLGGGFVSLPVVLVFIFVLYRLQPKVRALEDLRVNLDSLLPAVTDVTALLDRSDKPYIRSGDRPVRPLEEGIRFEDVSFAYAPEWGRVLEEVSTFIPAGKTTALVGPSGAGKSTLIKLLFRFYDPVEGEITIDGVPLPALDLAAWRERAALVSQDIYVFNTTVRENIAYGRPSATDAEVVEAAKRANAHAFIEALPEGYDTRVGERGTRLSGGQQQRIALARAIIRDPDLLILDEATNALDAIAEHLIQEALDAFGRDRTVVVIAHRLATIERADHIIVMEEGRIREQGSLKELLALDGLFARMYRLQHRTALTHELPN